MYADNSRTLALTAIREWSAAHFCRIGLKPTAAFSHRSTIYAEPASEQLIEQFNGSVELSIRAIAARQWFVNARASWSTTVPTRSHLRLSESTPLADVAISDYRSASSAVNSIGVQTEASRTVGKEIAIGISGSFSASFLHEPDNRTRFDIGINLYF